MPALSSDMLTNLSGSVVASMVDSMDVDDNEKNLLRSAGWYVYNTRMGQTRILSTLSKKFGLPQTQCDRLIRTAFGQNVYMYRSKAMNKSFTDDLKRVDTSVNLD